MDSRIIYVDSRIIYVDSRIIYVDSRIMFVDSRIIYVDSRVIYVDSRIIYVDRCIRLWIQFYTPKPNCELFRRSFLYAGAAIWSSRPCDVKAAISANSCKSRYLKWRKLRN